MKKYEEDPPAVLAPNCRHSQTFTVEEEKTLEDYLVTCSQMFHGFTSKNVRKLAYDNSSIRSIYFNPDLNPAEAQQAYLLRKERRESRQGTMNSAGDAGDDTMLNPLAQPFSTASEGST